MDQKYLRPGFDFALAHAIEEAGEFLASAGKTQRWGRLSVNPELPAEQQETNAEWLRREMRDLTGALTRLNDAMRQDPLSRTEVMREALGAARTFLSEHPPESGYCCCGSAIAQHGMGDGHSPVDDLQYAADSIVEQIDKALGGAG